MPNRAHVSIAALLVTLAAAPAQAQMCGDCDGDGRSGYVLDALVATQIAAGLLTPDASQARTCDVNSSGSVSVLDALHLAQSAAGLPVTLMCPAVAVAPPWLLRLERDPALFDALVDTRWSELELGAPDEGAGASWTTAEPNLCVYDA